jgi:transposase
MERADEVNLSRQDGEALIERLQRDALTASDQRVLEQVLRWYFWLLFALQEARFSLKRLRALVFGDRSKKRPQRPSSGDVSASGDGTEGRETAAVKGSEAMADRASTPPSSGERRLGHGRQGAQAYRGAEHVVCRHETLAIGERCPVCGRGRL